MMETLARRVIITGAPRSGTTLVCHLLNKLEETVALDEPFKLSSLVPAGAAGDPVPALEGLFSESRRTILEHGWAITKQEGGAVPDNTFTDEVGFDRLRKKKAISRTRIAITKPLEPDFLLCIKHPTAFTALLASLSVHFPCVAILRNPLATLASWNTVDLRVRKGHAPRAEQLYPGLRERLGAIEDRLDRQVELLSWFFEQYAAHLSDDAFVRYEDLVASGGRALRVITPRAEVLAEPLESRNSTEVYGSALISKLGARLLRSDGAYWRFYSRDSVEEFLNR